MEFYPEKFKKFREMRGMTQGEIADAIGCTKQAVHNYEKGKVKPKTKTVPKLAHILQCGVQDISDLMIEKKRKDG